MLKWVSSSAAAPGNPEEIRLPGARGMAALAAAQASGVRLSPVKIAGTYIAASCHRVCTHTASTMRVELIGHFKPCMTDIYLYIDARVADYIHTHP